MAKRGPHPRSKAPKGTHIDFTDDERSILTAMGTGDVKAKIHYLIQQESDRQHPRTKSESLARWITLRKDALKKAKLTQIARGYMIEMGFTEAEIREIEDAEDLD